MVLHTGMSSSQIGIRGPCKCYVTMVVGGGTQHYQRYDEVGGVTFPQKKLLNTYCKWFVDALRVVFTM